jgi:hypothetical protein
MIRTCDLDGEKERILEGAAVVSFKVLPRHLREQMRNLSRYPGRVSNWVPPKCKYSMICSVQNETFDTCASNLGCTG